jgi:hypothetical protein
MWTFRRSRQSLERDIILLWNQCSKPRPSRWTGSWACVGIWETWRVSWEQKLGNEKFSTPRALHTHNRFSFIAQWTDDSKENPEKLLQMFRWVPKGSKECIHVYTYALTMPTHTIEETSFAMRNKGFVRKRRTRCCAVDRALALRGPNGQMSTHTKMRRLPSPRVWSHKTSQNKNRKSASWFISPFCGYSFESTALTKIN